MQFNLLETRVKAPYVGERSVESGRILGQQVLEKLGGDELRPARSSSATASPASRCSRTAQTGVQESLADRRRASTIARPVRRQGRPANENYAAWEALLAANPDAVALVGLCAPDMASLGKLQAANPRQPFVAGGYDLTAENLAAIKAGNAYVSLGQTPFMQGYLPVKMLVDTHPQDATDRGPVEGRLPRRRHRDRDRRQRAPSRSTCRR